MRYLRILASALAITLAACVKTQQTKIDGLPIKPGDSTTQVQAALQTSLEAEPYENSVNKGGYSLRLQSKGVWTFFGGDRKATTIRLEAPFKGSVAGIKIGDSLSTLKSKLGEPIREPSKFGNNNSYLYYVDDTYSARFDINESQKVETIFLINTIYTTTVQTTKPVNPVLIHKILGGESLSNSNETDIDKYNKMIE
jgi:hypothetical protein